MNKQLKKLTWKYFWEQKLEEVSGFTSILIVGTCFLYLSALFGRVLDEFFYNIIKGDSELLFETMKTLWEHLAYSVLGILCLAEIAGVFFVIYWLIESWISSNWKKAKKRARKELGK